MLYLDNAATTKLNPEVLTAMLDSLNSYVIIVSDFFQYGYFRHFAVKRVNMCHCFVFFHINTTPNNKFPRRDRFLKFALLS